MYVVIFIFALSFRTGIEKQSIFSLWKPKRAFFVVFIIEVKKKEEKTKTEDAVSVLFGTSTSDLTSTY